MSEHFRKKPVVIEAVQWDGRNDDEVISWAKAAPPRWWVRRRGDHLNIPTLEGDHLASVGDWIIRGVAGEIYPCKPDIFAATYEPADAPAPAAPRPVTDEEVAEYIRARNASPEAGSYHEVIRAGLEAFVALREGRR